MPLVVPGLGEGFSKIPGEMRVRIHAGRKAARRVRQRTVPVLVLREPAPRRRRRDAALRGREPDPDRLVRSPLKLSRPPGSVLHARGKMLAVAIPGGLFRLFAETISGNELEKLLKDAIVARR